MQNHGSDLQELQKMLVEQREANEKIKLAVEHVTNQIREHESRFETILLNAELQISKLSHSFDPSLLKESVKQGYFQLNQVMTDTVTTISGKTRRLLWEKFVLGVSGAVLGVLLTNLYLNNESPWELHHRVMEERLIGAATIKNWDQLNYSDRHKILDTLDKRAQQEIFKDLHLKFGQ